MPFMLKKGQKILKFWKRKVTKKTQNRETFFFNFEQLVWINLSKIQVNLK